MEDGKDVGEVGGGKEADGEHVGEAGEEDGPGLGTEKWAEGAAAEKKEGFDGEGDEDVVGLESDAEAGGDADQEAG